MAGGESESKSKLEELLEKDAENNKEIDQLMDEEIRKLPTNVRAQLCAEGISRVLLKFNCIFNPICHISNAGSHFDVKIVALAFPTCPCQEDPDDLNKLN